jgi:hypothetical protein
MSNDGRLSRTPPWRRRRRGELGRRPPDLSVRRSAEFAAGVRDGGRYTDRSREEGL